MGKFLAEKHTGMRIDHSGILGELDKHLVWMAERFYAGDIKAVDEFLQLWCLDDNRPKE